MNNLIIFLFISCGVSAIWSLSDIFTPARNIVAKRAPSFFRKMLLCMECSSFWIGFGCSFIFFPGIEVNQYNQIVSCFLSAVSSGVATYLTIKIINKKELI